MRDVIIDIIKKGWEQKQPVLSVIQNISSATGLNQGYAMEEFVNLVFTCKP